MMSFEKWYPQALHHRINIDNLIYPAFGSLKERVTSSPKLLLRARSHHIQEHPVYNFLHNYYQYSTHDLRKFSPGLGVYLMGARVGLVADEQHLLDERFMIFDEQGGQYDAAKFGQHIVGKGDWDRFTKARDVLAATAAKTAFFGCFGMHEWAMLYSGNGSPVKRHQEKLLLRVSQEVIDVTVGAPGVMRCTHFDAFRFFQPGAKPFNAIAPTRSTQKRYEQPGCIHANMDLFRYAYTLYPLIPSVLLVNALEVAVEARKIDLRASPYDVSGFEGCETPICVETPQGRKLYIEEQERIANMGYPVRKKLLAVYEEVIAACSTP
jgi:hypothetical protein